MKATLRSALGQAQGLGAAKEGASHWWMQRLTSVALVPLALWFVFSLASLPDMDYVHLRIWLHSPISASLMVLLLIAMFYHLQLGMQVIIEDYVHAGTYKLVAIIAVSFGCWLLGAASILSVLKIFLS